MNFAATEEGSPSPPGCEPGPEPPDLLRPDRRGRGPASSPTASRPQTPDRPPCAGPGSAPTEPAAQGNGSVAPRGRLKSV